MFRQSLAGNHADMVYKLKSGGSTGTETDLTKFVTDSANNKVPLVTETLLVDCFILAGTELKLPREVRFCRSENRTNPASAKDSLGAKDMEGNAFSETTKELDFIRNLSGGCFSVILLPTQVADIERWQLFAYNKVTKLIDSFNIERSDDGFFNTQGTQLYYQKGLRELEDRLSRLRQELAAQSTPHAQRYAKNIQLRNKREELNKKSAKLTQLLQLQFGIPSSQPMRLFHTDPRGLTVSSGLLGFAYTDSQSYLFESALGRMAIYFKGANKQFFSAYYDVNTARARWSLAAGSGSLTLVSRATDSQVNDTSIVVANGTDADHCVVTIGNAKTGLTETWNDIPREASAFAQVLNGEAGEKSFVGKLKTSLSGAAITTIDLKDGLPREVPAGSTLLVEDSSSGSKQTSRLIITAKADSGAKQITITSATPTLAADAKVYLLLYDYASKASSNRSGYTLDNGNLMINVVVGSVKGKVGNATASRTTEAQIPQWTADAPGSALYFDGTNDYLPGTPPNNFEHEGDITLEAWVRPLDFTGDTRLIHCKSGASHYSLGLRQTPVNSALSLDGTGDYVALPAASKLGLTNNDFTVESWIKVNFAATGHEQTILGNVGGGSHTALHLVIRNDKPYLGFHGNELADPTVLTKGTWYHLAFRYTAATKEQAIFVNGDKTSHRAAPAHYSGTGNL